jgi:Flp pilus assembly pilin Flp
MSLPRASSSLPTEELGAVFLEYGLLITLIAGVVAVGLDLFGPAVAALFDDADLLDWLTP